MMTTALHKRYPGNKHLLSEFKLSITMGIRTTSRVYRKRHGLSITWLPVHVSISVISDSISRENSTH